MMRRTSQAWFAMITLCLCAVNPVFAQPAETMARVMQGMRTHTLTGQVLIVDDNGQAVPAPAGLDVGFQVKVFGRAKKGALMFKTAEGGHVTFTGIRSNTDPGVQAQMSYEAFVDYEGVRFPFPVEMIPEDGMVLSPFKVYAVSTNLKDIGVIQRIDLIPSEQAIQVMIVYEIVNRSRKAVDLSTLPGGGLVLPCPNGAKQPELHEKDKKNTEVRGTDVIYSGTLLPQSDTTASIRVGFAIPYRSDTFRWEQRLPVDLIGFTVAAPMNRGRNHIRPIRLQLNPIFEGPTTKIINGNGDSRWRTLRSSGTTRTPGEVIGFEIANIPVASKANLYFLISSILLVSVLIVFGFRSRKQDGETFSKSHLTEERDRLVRALARLKKAADKGMISSNKHRKEEEAIRARLVSLYRAIDKMDLG